MDIRDCIWPDCRIVVDGFSGCEHSCPHAETMKRGAAMRCDVCDDTGLVNVDTLSDKQPCLWCECGKQIWWAQVEFIVHGCDMSRALHPLPAGNLSDYPESEGGNPANWESR
jgi:hypothetical protein